MSADLALQVDHRSRIGMPALVLQSGAPAVTERPESSRPSRSFRLETTWAASAAELREAQRLRYRVFAVEMGARLVVPSGTPPGHDVDPFDDFCAHLLIRAVPLTGGGSEVVGTARVLTPHAARRAGGLYGETEFDMTRLAPLRPRMAELGRSCIDPRWRTGGPLLALWSALGKFMVSLDLDVVFGCASVSLKDGGHQAASVWRRLSATHLAPAERRVMPLRPLPPLLVRDGIEPAPPLIDAYLNCGAEVLGPPAWDRDFGTADLPMLVRLKDMPGGHRRHFLERSIDGNDRAFRRPGEVERIATSASALRCARPPIPGGNVVPIGEG